MWYKYAYEAPSQLYVVRMARWGVVAGRGSRREAREGVRVHVRLRGTVLKCGR